MTATASSTHYREKAIESIGKLPPFSPVLTKLLATLAKDDIMVSELANWIEKDTVLTGNVLRMVNSAAYGRSGSVSSVRHAITILGTNRLRNIVLGLSVCNMMSQIKLPAGWSSKDFNLHSVAVANMADLLAQYLPVEYAEGAFVGGLLHDVGKLLIAISSSEEYASAMLLAAHEGRPVHELELEIFGFSHAEMSQKVLEVWKLPQPVQSAARNHHTPEAETVAKGLIGLSRAIQMADELVNATGTPATPSSNPNRDPNPILESFGLGHRAARILADYEQELSALNGIA